MTYIKTKLHREIVIDSIITMHYFEYMKDFVFRGESHDFWEFLYVDKGEIHVTADSLRTTLKKGDIIFHKPNEFHNVEATGTIAPNLVVVSFSSSSPVMGFFENKCFHIDEAERSLLAEIITEARNCFSMRLDDPYLTHMVKNSPEVFGS